MGLRLDRGQSMRTFFCAILRNDRGATAIEYGLIVSLIVIAMVVSLTTVATKTISMWNNVSAVVGAH